MLTCGGFSEWYVVPKSANKADPSQFRFCWEHRDEIREKSFDLHSARSGGPQKTQIVRMRLKYVFLAYIFGLFFNKKSTLCYVSFCCSLLCKCF